MYAVIRTGGKQERVSEGQRLQVELLGREAGSEVSFTPVCVVPDGGSVLARRSELEGATVLARVVGEAKGPKITGFTYKPKSNNRRRWGHRQGYSVVEVLSIKLGSSPEGAAGAGGSRAGSPEGAGALEVGATSGAKVREPGHERTSRARPSKAQASKAQASKAQVSNAGTEKEETSQSETSKAMED